MMPARFPALLTIFETRYEAVVLAFGMLNVIVIPFLSLNWGRKVTLDVARVILFAEVLRSIMSDNQTCSITMLSGAAGHGSTFNLSVVAHSKRFPNPTCSVVLRLSTWERAASHPPPRNAQWISHRGLVPTPTKLQARKKSATREHTARYLVIACLENKTRRRRIWQ